MSQTYMQKYIGKNIYKVSNPPGGHSSFKIGWDQPASEPMKRNRSNNLKNNNSGVYESVNNNSLQYNEGNRSFVYNLPHLQHRKLPEQQFINRSFVQRPNNYVKNNNQQKSQQMYYKQTSNQSLQSLPYPQMTQNYSFVSNKQPHSSYSPNKQSYKQYMDPNFIQPLNINQNHSFSHLYQWQQSTRQMQEQLKYLQQKNKQLKQKIYGGGYANQKPLNYYNNDYQRKRISSLSDTTEQLQLALQQRYKNKINNVY